MIVRNSVFLTCIVLTHVLALPQSPTDTSSFVVSTTEQTVQNDKTNKEGDNSVPSIPKIYEMRIETNVSNRFAKTLATSKVRNVADRAQEATFSIVLPEKAFISKFVMVIDGKNYEAYVKGKEEAKQIYDQAVASGLGAAHVAASARDSNRFTVSVNVEPRSKAVFLLTYEELLEREDNHYELVINIHPKQPVKDLFVHVNINESLPIKFVKAPPIRSGNDISDPKGDLDPRADIKIINSTTAVVLFSPNLERQKELAKTLGTDDGEGLSGQFVVQYDVERSNSGGEILLEDGYFVHFFAPTDIPALPKHVLFVLDTSGSMYGTKIEQLKTAMRSILGELKPQDFFHLVDFNTLVQVLNLHNSSESVKYPSTEPNYYYLGNSNAPVENIFEKQFPKAYSVDADNIKKANELVAAMEANGGTNIYDALKVALHLVNEEKQKNPNKDAPQPLIIFLTDGDATVGVTDPVPIIGNISELNMHSVPIFSLSFGYGADRSLLQKLSLRNNGFSRHIYEAADASLQLEDFYRQISSPLLSNVRFKYTEEAKDVTKTVFPILFGGSELVVAGVLDKEFPNVPKVSGWGINGPIDLVPVITRPVGSLERLWAYLTVQQLLDAREVAENKTAYEKKALDLALKYSFVTPVSSLVVVKPNATDSSIEPEAADKASNGGNRFGNVATLSAGYPALGSPGAPGGFANAFAPLASPPQYLPFTSTSVAQEYEAAEEDELTDSFAEKTEAVTTFHPEITTALSELESLKINLPWLGTVLSADNIIHTSAGDLKLGLNETSADDIICPNSPKNGNGFCKYLHECPEVYSLLTNIHIFQQYYCLRNGYAAICCPPKDHIKV